MFRLFVIVANLSHLFSIQLIKNEILMFVTFMCKSTRAEKFASLAAIVFVFFRSKFCAILFFLNQRLYSNT